MGHVELTIKDMVGAYPTCKHCGSRDILRNAWAAWNFADGQWRLTSTVDHFACDACGNTGTPNWELDDGFRTKRIARLNDALRRGEGEHVSVMITAGVQAMGKEFRHEINHAVASFDSFTEDNDPLGEHDFGAVEVAGEKLFWKVDYFDNSLTVLSADPANPALTHRVLTIMLASEY